MKLKTLEGYIRNTAIPYDVLYKRAEKTLRVEYKEDSDSITATAYDNSGHFARSCYYKNEPTCAVYNEYSFPR